MKFKLICVGKTEESYLKEGEQIYLERLKHYCKTEKIEIPELKNVKKLSKEQIKIEEGKLILSKIENQDQIILLDENGKDFNSVEFSEFIQKKLNQGGKSICFIVGGAFGFSEDIYQKAQGKINLSSMTFSHQMVRLFFLEQLYRAQTILKGEPYHHQ